MQTPSLRVLLIEDDQDDYILVSSLLSEISSTSYEIEWAPSYESGLEEIDRGSYDICLLDYRLGSHNGLELLQKIIEQGCRAPVILLTGQGDYHVDLEAMKSGASDYLVKGQINPPLLERSIRYSIERRRAEDALRASEKQLRLLSSQLLKYQESERKRVASELHDDLGQILTAVKFSIENALNHMESDTLISKTLQPLIPTLQHAIDEVRRIYTHLRPSLLDDLGILATIGWFCREFQRLHDNIEILLDTANITESDIPEPLKLVIYRIMQEALDNTAKFSSADTVWLTLERSHDSLLLTIRDNGIGFDPEAALSVANPKRGLGLASMQERAELSGGSLTIDSGNGGGTTIKAHWPC